MNIKKNNDKNHLRRKNVSTAIRGVSLLSFLSLVSEANIVDTDNAIMTDQPEPAIKRIDQIQKEIKLIIDERNQVVQYWNNWQNWPNWGDWNNWGNWGDWNNWGNWGNW